MPHDFTLTASIPAPPSAVYAAWLSSDGHTRMTGSSARATDQVGGDFTAWDGYITGRNQELEPDRRIVQSWRTTEFDVSHDDSQIEVTLEPENAGTKLTLVHRNVPDGHDSYETGWVTHYFEPMRKHFAK